MCICLFVVKNILRELRTSIMWHLCIFGIGLAYRQVFSWTYFLMSLLLNLLKMNNFSYNLQFSVKLAVFCISNHIIPLRTICACFNTAQLFLWLNWWSRICICCLSMQIGSGAFSSKYADSIPWNYHIQWTAITSGTFLHEIGWAWAIRCVTTDLVGCLASI